MCEVPDLGTGLSGERLGLHLQCSCLVPELDNRVFKSFTFCHICSTCICRPKPFFMYFYPSHIFLIDFSQAHMHSPLSAQLHYL